MRRCYVKVYILQKTTKKYGPIKPIKSLLFMSKESLFPFSVHTEWEEFLSFVCFFLVSSILSLFKNWVPIYWVFGSWVDFSIDFPLAELLYLDLFVYGSIEKCKGCMWSEKNGKNFCGFIRFPRIKFIIIIGISRCVYV